MSVTSLATLLTEQTPEQIFAQLLAYYTANNFPTTSWQTGGVERTRLMAISTVLSDISTNYVPTITSGGFLSLAAALTDPSWLQLLAAQNFSVDFNPAMFTVGQIVLSTVASGAGPYTVNDGDLIATFAQTGNRYISNGNGTQTIPMGGSKTLFFVAEFAGAQYNDASNQTSPLITLVTSLPGVILSNSGGAYTPVSHIGSGTGTITPSGSPPSHQVRININTSGTATTAIVSYSLDGSPYVTLTGPGPTYSIGVTGITFTLANGTGSPSFIENDSYLFNSPGSWIDTPGSNVETNASLEARCQARWSSLSPIPVTNLYYLLATSTPNVGSQVTQVIVVPDAVINSKVNIVIAGPAGALQPAVISAVQQYVSAHAPITVYPVVVSPSTQSIAISANITVQASQLIAAQNAIATALINYIDAVGINGTIRINSIVELIMQVQGVIDVTYGSATINGSAANLTLGNSTTFVIPSQPDLTGLAYTTV
jgi:Baseplate J-like protein